MAISLFPQLVMRVDMMRMITCIDEAVPARIDGNGTYRSTARLVFSYLHQFFSHLHQFGDGHRGSVRES